MSLILNEYEWAENMIREHELGNKPVETLSRVARYYHANHYSKHEIRSLLDDFLLKCDPSASLPKWSDTLDKVVKSCNKYSLVILDGVDVSYDELEKIEKLNGKQIRRLAFTLLCSAKYWDAVSETNIPITATLTRYAGEICTWLQVYAGPPHHPIIAKSSECMLQIIGSKNMDEYISDRNLSLIYAMQRHMEDKIEKAEKQLSERIDAKADNLIFDQETSTIQLVTTTIEFDEEGEEVIKQTPLGEPIFVRADKAAAIINAEINEDGDLIIFFEDETTTNLGKVVGNDGAVYVPHVDEHRILSFTVEERPGDVPPPVDLNPNDEWGSMGDRDTASNYVWEEM